MAILGPMPDYDGLVKRHALTAFHGVRADWNIAPDGGIVAMRDGDFQIGDPSFSAMHRLVSAWRVNAPAMQLLFDSIYGLQAMRPKLVTDLDESHRLKDPMRIMRTKEELNAYHAADEALDAADFGRASLSGSLILLIGTFLGRFRSDMKPLQQEWEKGRPVIGGLSIGLVIPAAANAFRHVDEWTEARHEGTFRKQQKASMDTLQKALNTEAYTERPQWELVLDGLSEGDFERLTGSILGFANEVALMIRARAAPVHGSP